VALPLNPATVAEHVRSKQKQKKERGPPLGGSWRRTLSIAHRGHMARCRPGAHRPVAETLAAGCVLANRPSGPSFETGDTPGDVCGFPSLVGIRAVASTAQAAAPIIHRAQ